MKKSPGRKERRKMEHRLKVDNAKQLQNMYIVAQRKAVRKARQETRSEQKARQEKRRAELEAEEE